MDLHKSTPLGFTKTFTRIPHTHIIESVVLDLCCCISFHRYYPRMYEYVYIMNKISVYRKYTRARDILKERNAFGGDNIRRFYTHKRMHHTCGCGLVASYPPLLSDYKINNRKHSNKLKRMEKKKKMPRENVCGVCVHQLREPRLVYRMYSIVI